MLFGWADTRRQASKLHTDQRRRCDADGANHTHHPPATLLRRRLGLVEERLLRGRSSHHHRSVQRPKGRSCVAITRVLPFCPGGLKPDASGNCPPLRRICGSGQHWDGSKCVPTLRIKPLPIPHLCPSGQRWDGKQCVPVRRIYKRVTPSKSLLQTIKPKGLE